MAVEDGLIPRDVRTVEDEVRQLMHEIFHRDAVEGLMAFRVLTTRYLPWLGRTLVHRRRREGGSWAGIGRMLGMSRQAVQKRYDREWTVAELLPPSVFGHRDQPERQLRELLRRLASIREQQRVDASDQVVPW